MQFVLLELITWGIIKIFMVYNESHRDLVCPFCNSSRIIKHGKTSANIQRYRCMFCHKTWVQSETPKQDPDIGALSEAYLSGYSYRDLRSIYHSSPIRINQKIREYLTGCSPWEEYLDACTPKHESRLIHLVGKKFKCNLGSSKGHTMFLALAIDALSTVVLGFELGKSDSTDIWVRLLDRMNCRGFVCPTFMSYGIKTIDQALKIVFPYSATYNNFTRACYDKELKNELFFAPNVKKLILDAINAYQNNQSSHLENYLVIFKDKKMKQIVLNSKDYFLNRLQERINKKPTIRFEGLLRAFQKRFEKFHMIKYDPLPIINGWIGWWMLVPLPIGFSRLSLYLQYPYITHFKNFNCGTLPVPMNLSLDSPEMKTFIVELAVRSIHIPVK